MELKGSLGISERREEWENHREGKWKEGGMWEECLREEKGREDKQKWEKEEVSATTNIGVAFQISASSIGLVSPLWDRNCWGTHYYFHEILKFDISVLFLLRDPRSHTHLAT